MWSNNFAMLFSGNVQWVSGYSIVSPYCKVLHLMFACSCCWMEYIITFLFKHIFVAKGDTDILVWWARNSRAQLRDFYCTYLHYYFHWTSKLIVFRSTENCIWWIATFVLCFVNIGWQPKTKEALVIKSSYSWPKLMKVLLYLVYPSFFSSKDQVHKDDTLGLLTNEGLVYVEGHGEWYHVSGCV